MILHTAHHALEGLVLSKEQLRFNRLVGEELAQLIYDGLWFSSLSRDLRTYVMSSQRVVSGEVRIRLDHGSANVVGRRSPLSLYDKDLATYDEGDAFDHASAVGFIEIFGLPLRVEAARHGAVGKRHGAAWTWTDPLLADLPRRSPRARRSRGRFLAAGVRAGFRAGLAGALFAGRACQRTTGRAARPREHPGARRAGLTSPGVQISARRAHVLAGRAPGRREFATGGPISWHRDPLMP